jgi:hypothetical protein
MATPSDAEVCAIDTEFQDPSRASAVANGAQNILFTCPFQISTTTLTAGYYKGRFKFYLTAAVPSDTNCLGAEIGDMAIALMMDSVQSTTAPYTARLYIKNSSGWQYHAGS